MKPRNILLVGAGGTTNCLLDTLVRSLGEQDKLVIMDGDRFEKRNAVRQIFCVPGENKAHVLRDRVISLGFKNCESIPFYLDEETMGSLDDYDVIISAVDNSDSRILLRELAFQQDCLLILTGNATDMATTGVYHPLLPASTDLTLNFPNLVEPDGLMPSESCTSVTHVEEHPQTIIANHMAGMGALMALAEWREFDFNFDDRSYMPYEWHFTTHSLSTKKITPPPHED